MPGCEGSNGVSLGLRVERFCSCWLLLAPAADGGGGGGGGGAGVEWGEGGGAHVFGWRVGQARVSAGTGTGTALVGEGG
jgi:hypothetical protein